VLTKRGRSGGHKVGAGQGVLHLATAFPRPVWLDHLLPRLTLAEAVTLWATCKSIRTIVADMRADLGERWVKDLKAMLTCFPKAHTIELYEDKPMTEAEQDSLLAWLKERGNSLTSIHEECVGVGPFLRRAWRAGIFKTVKSVSLDLEDEDERDLLIDGVVSGVESIYVTFSREAPQVERAALAFLRHFPALKEMSFFMGREDTGLHPFIPPSLEALTLELGRCPTPVRLFGSLPPMIESSGAKLRRLALKLNKLDEDTARGVRSVLQACASTLKEVNLTTSTSFESAVEVAEGLASCQHLERLEAPISTFAVMPPGGGTTFRLVTLHLSPVRGDVNRALSSLALWGLMAGGCFPTLGSLKLSCDGWRWGPESAPAVMAAFEGVAGTLKDLTLIQGDFETAVEGGETDGVVRQLGEAIGKLRRLETLELSTFRQGRQLHRMAQGIAKGACPALHTLTCEISSGAAWLAVRPSLVLPSVQALRVTFGRGAGDDEPLALAHALTVLDYRGAASITNSLRGGGQGDHLRAVLKPRLSALKFPC
jgi:hypothetical protein